MGARFARQAGVLVALVLVAAACASAPRSYPPTPRPLVTRTATPPPAARPTPTPTELARPTATPTPRQATHDPHSLDVGRLSYNTTACWSSDWFDDEGHNTPGMEVRFSLTISNPSRLDSGHIWITIETTDVWDINPSITRANWKGRDAWGNERTMYLAAPPVKGKDDRRYRWRVLMATPFDAHYSVTVSVGPPPGSEMVSLSRLTQIAYFGEMWTASRVC